MSAAVVDNEDGWHDVTMDAVRDRAAQSNAQVLDKDYMEAKEKTMSSEGYFGMFTKIH